MRNVLNKTFAANMAISKSHNVRQLNFFHTNPNNFGDTNRNDSASYGYPDYIDFYHMYNFYNRSGFAKALIDIIADRCFAEGFEVVDGEEGKETPFTRDVKQFNRQHKMQRVWREAFKQRDLGQYSTIVPIFEERIAKADFKNPVQRATKVLSVNPFYQPECRGEGTYGDDPFDTATFNKPTEYILDLAALSGRQTTNAQQYNLHPSRVFLLTTATTGILGQPALEAPYNALFDANKIRGAASEGYRKNAKQRTVLSADSPEAARAMNQRKEDVDQSIDEFENNFNNTLRLAGSKVYSLQSNLADPTGAFTIAIQESCASRRVPVTELIGFMTGERSSSENANSFNKHLKSTQDSDYGPTMVDFYLWLASLGVISKPSSDDVRIKWPDISEPSTGEKLDNASKMTKQNKEAIDAGQEPPWVTEEIRETGGANKKKPNSEFDDLDDLKKDEPL